MHNTSGTNKNKQNFMTI